MCLSSFCFDPKCGGERERNGLMDQLGIKPTTTKKWKKKKKRKREKETLLQLEMRQQFPSTQFARESIGVDGNQRRKNPLLVTSFPIHQFQSSSFFSVSSFLFIFVYSSFLLLDDSRIVDAHLLYISINQKDSEKALTPFCASLAFEFLFQFSLGRFASIQSIFVTKIKASFSSAHKNR